MDHLKRKFLNTMASGALVGLATKVGLSAALIDSDETPEEAQADSELSTKAGVTAGISTFYAVGTGLTDLLKPSTEAITPTEDTTDKPNDPSV